MKLRFVLDAEDIIDEAIYYFKANVFFKNYEIKVTKHTHTKENVCGADIAPSSMFGPRKCENIVFIAE